MREVDLRGGRASDVDRRSGCLRERRQDVAAEALDEARRLRALRRRRRVDGDRGGVAGGVEPRRRDGSDARRVPKCGRELREAGRVAGGRQTDGELQRPVEAAAEARGEQVVRMAGCLLGGIVAGVARAEPQPECRRGQCEQQRGRPERGPHGAALDEPDPAEPEALARLARARAADAVRPTRLPVNISKRGQQRQRGGEHEQHAERSRDRDAVEEADAEREHAEQRDHDRCAGEEDRPAGRVHRQLERSFDVAAVLAVRVAEARDDEEGVVDADAEPDHQRELGGEVDHVDDVAAEPDHAQAGTEAEERRHDRQAHREQRAEAEQQDDHGGQEADAGREADARLLRPA